MSGKVRRVDWSPSEWLAGTRGVLTMREVGVYDCVLNLIYDRGGKAPNDAAFIAGHFKPEGEGHRAQAWLTRHTRAALDRLIELEKLHASADDLWLTNGRADTELGKAHGRIISATHAGIASGQARRDGRVRQPSIRRRSAADGPPMERPKVSAANDLARTAVRNHQPPTINHDHKNHTDAARDPARDRGAPGRAPSKPDPRLEALAAKARAKLMKGE
jgi:hypothetical protein